VPWVSLYLPLPFSSSTSSSSSSNGASSNGASPDPDPDFDTLTPPALHRTYTALLAARDALVAAHLADPRTAPHVPRDDGGRRASHNVFLTKRHMHLVPRTERLVEVPRRPSSPSSSSSSGGKEQDDDDDDSAFSISLNGLVYLGFWAAASERDWADLCALGLGEVLTRAGYANDEYSRGEDQGEER